MDWTFAVSQVVMMITAIVSAIIAGIITVRYQKSDSLGVSQRTKDKFKAVILAMLGLLGIGIPLGSCIKIAYDFYLFVVKSPNAPVTRNDATIISVWVFFFFVLLAQSFYNSSLTLRSYRQAQREKREREFRARQDAELKPLDAAIEKLHKKIHETDHLVAPRDKQNLKPPEDS